MAGLTQKHAAGGKLAQAMWRWREKVGMRTRGGEKASLLMRSAHLMHGGVQASCRRPSLEEIVDVSGFIFPAFLFLRNLYILGKYCFDALSFRQLSFHCLRVFFVLIYSVSFPFASVSFEEPFLQELCFFGAFLGSFSRFDHFLFIPGFFSLFFFAHRRYSFWRV